MTDRAVLVTGSSRGIGRAVVEAFAAGGDRVAIHHRDSAEAAEKLRAGLPGSGHVVVRADLTDPEAVRSMVDRAAEQLGGLDVLVNNAGTYGDRDVPHPIFGTSYDEWQARWRQVLETNLTGAGNVIWCAAQHLRERGGRIVNVSSRGAAIRAQSPFDRVARPEEIAAAVHWLASPEAEWASGTIVDLNGASYLRS
ncbi:SDR family NAD(P)-dependent oxidoreductase [Micromonospora sp. WMMD729]|uniref:SDR family NAD(P)-dependent oxidoreductase n=1 Tax=Micromonospora sp. WMMD729 TaxID=3404127 RepID=UPI003BF46D2C